MGGYALGYDQYAQYVSVLLPNDIMMNSSSQLSITGPFNRVAYVSATLYLEHFVQSNRTSLNDIGKQVEYLDYEMPIINDEPNPYQAGNPSVFSYVESAEKKAQTNGDIPPMTMPSKPANIKRPKEISNANGQIYVFRLDAEESREFVTDDIAEDGCSRAYLFSYKSEEQDVIIFRIKVPQTFVHDENPDKMFQHYDVRYFSVTSSKSEFVANVREYLETYLRYWTVNSRMLESIKDQDGYAYVFMGPDQFSLSLHIQQRLSDRQPPLYTWGRYKGYFLGSPSYAIILRYRAPDDAWEGNPDHAHCYQTAESIRPIAKGSLGDYIWWNMVTIYARFNWSGWKGRRLAAINSVMIFSFIVYCTYS